MHMLWRMFKPATLLMNRLSYPYRFSLIGLLFVMPLALALFILLGKVEENSLVVQKELSGTQYIRPLRSLLEHLSQTNLVAQQYYLSRPAANKDGPSPLDTWLLQQAQLEEDFKQLTREQQQFGRQLNTTSQFNELDHTWQTLKSKGLAFSAQDSFQFYASLISQVRTLLSQVGDSSNLILDNTLDTYYLINTLVTRLPQAQDLLAQAALVNTGFKIRLWPGPVQVTSSSRVTSTSNPTATGTEQDAVSSSGGASSSELNQLVILRYLLQPEISAINTNLDRAFHNSSPLLQNRLSLPSLEFNSRSNTFLDELDRELAGQGILTASALTPASPGNSSVSLGGAATSSSSASGAGSGVNSLAPYQALAASTLASSFKLWDQTIVQVDILLTARLEGFNGQKNLVVLFALVSLGVVAYLLVAFYLGTIQTTQRLTLLADQLLRPKPTPAQKIQPDLIQREEARLKGLDVSFEALAKFLLSIEAELNARESRFYTVFHTVPVPMSILDLSQNSLIEVNEAFSAVTGYTREEATGRSLKELKLWANYEDQADFQQLLMTQSRVQEGEMRFRHKSGEEGTLLFSAQLLELNGKPSILLAGVDITARKQSQEALEHSKERFRRLSEVAFEGIGISANGILLDANPKLVQLTGYPLEDLLGKDVLTFVAPESWELVRERRHSKLEEVYEIKLMTSEGQVLPVEIKTRDLPMETENGSGEANLNQVLRVFSINDLSEKRHLEAQLLQAQKLQAVGQLAGGIAHDFNNLLTIILSYSELLLACPVEELPQMHSDIEQIKEAGERAAALTRQLLAFSRRQVLNLQPLNLNEVVVGLVKMLDRLIGEDIELSTVLEPAISLVKADAGQLEQVILNLVVNARDAMPQGGKVVIETANVEVDESFAQQHFELQPGLCVMLAVSDTGHGMDASTQARIFEPFFTTKELGKGTGLGLATVHGIVKQCGGNIWVYSEIGHGTSFKIYLPVINQAVEEKQSPGVLEENLRRGSETILLVEDAVEVRQLIRSMLEREGYTILETASDEAEGFSQSYPETIDLLLTDVVMPKVNGREMAERLLQLRPNLKVLYMSGYTDNIIAHHGVIAYNTAFLPKPFTPKVLATQVRKTLDN